MRRADAEPDSLVGAFEDVEFERNRSAVDAFGRAHAFVEIVNVDFRDRIVFVARENRCQTVARTPCKVSFLFNDFIVRGAHESVGDVIERHRHFFA